MNTAVNAQGSYDLIAAAIRYVRARALEQPSLGEVAAHLGLSEFHLQRLFGAWVGISPKRFLQFLTAEHAKHALRSSRDVLDAALGVGLSGPGRLHDLLVACDAMTPGEVRAGGEGLEICFGRGDSPFGRVLIASTSRGICHFQFDAETAEDELRAGWPRATFRRDDGVAKRLLGEVFASFPRAAPLHLLLKGTNFQVQVWRALIRVPPGALVSYSAIAQAIGKPGAARAVGTAIADNAIALLIPCHRVVREDGALGGYRWGEERKAALIGWEAAHTISPRAGAQRPL